MCNRPPLPVLVRILIKFLMKRNINNDSKCPKKLIRGGDFTFKMTEIINFWSCFCSFKIGPRKKKLSSVLSVSYLSSLHSVSLGLSDCPFICLFVALSLFFLSLPLSLALSLPPLALLLYPFLYPSPSLFFNPFLLLQISCPSDLKSNKQTHNPFFVCFSRLFQLPSNNKNKHKQKLKAYHHFETRHKLTSFRQEIKLAYLCKKKFLWHFEDKLCCELVNVNL